MNQQTAQKLEKKRIQLIREKVNSLNHIKRRGIDYARDYEQDELIYDPEIAKFGRVDESNGYYLAVLFGKEKRFYFRKQGWKPCKEKFLKDYYKRMTNKELARFLHCSEKIVEKKLSKLKLKRNFQWDKKKDEFLITNLEKSNHWLAQNLNTTVSSIKGRIYRLKTKGDLPATKQRVIYDWTDDDDRFLLNNLDKSNQWLADHYNLKVSNIKSRLRKLREKGCIVGSRKRGKKKKNSEND